MNRRAQGSKPFWRCWATTMADRLFYICKYTPVELLEAYGAECVLLDHVPRSFDRSEELLHPNVCGFGKSVIEAVLSGTVKELVLVNCCDTIRAVYEILQGMNVCSFLYFCDLPHDGTGCAVETYAEEIRALAEAYGAYKGTRFDRDAFFRAFRPDRYEGRTGPYAAILGGRCPKELAGRIADGLPAETRNLSCAEGRCVSAPAGPRPSSDEELLGGYARCLLNQLPCMRMNDVTGRKTLFNDEDLKAVIYNTVKFCDFYGFEYADIKNTLNVPILKLETDYSDQSASQIRTRVEAFGECLTGLGMPAGNTSDETARLQENDPEMMRNDSTRPSGSGQGKEYFAGIDIGSTSTDAVLIDREKNILTKVIVPTSAKAANAFENVLGKLLGEAGLTRSDLTGIVTTGYGRNTTGAGDRSVTEISCHAKGAYFLDPEVRSVIDIGGQDSKVIRLNESGNVTNFVMNDKCAAGTGRFLEIMARALELSIDEMSEAGLKYKEDIVISSICTVFAESEIVSLIAQNKETCDIVHGLNASVASKAAALVNRVKAEPKFMMTGGVAKNRGVVRAISEKLNAEITTNEMAQYCGALGAALYALENARR